MRYCHKKILDMQGKFLKRPWRRRQSQVKYLRFQFAYRPKIIRADLKIQMRKNTNQT